MPIQFNQTKPHFCISSMKREIIAKIIDVNWFFKTKKSSSLGSCPTNEIEYFQKSRDSYIRWISTEIFGGMKWAWAINCWNRPPFWHLLLPVFVWVGMFEMLIFSLKTNKHFATNRYSRIQFGCDYALSILILTYGKTFAENEELWRSCICIVRPTNKYKKAEIRYTRVSCLYFLTVSGEQPNNFTISSMNHDR